MHDRRRQKQNQGISHKNPRSAKPEGLRIGARNDLHANAYLRAMQSVVPRIVVLRWELIFACRRLGGTSYRPGRYWRTTVASTCLLPVELVGSVVRGTVEANAPYAAYVEYGTGQRGAASAGAGAGPYSPNWPAGYASPRRICAWLSTPRAPAILDAFAKQGLQSRFNGAGTAAEDRSQPSRGPHIVARSQRRRSPLRG